MFTIDGMAWPWPCSIERAAEIRASELSGLMLNKAYFNDVIGTYMSYTVRVAIPLDQRDKHTALYDVLTDPVGEHTVVLPYNQSSVTVTGRIDNVGDVLVRLPNGGQYWKGLGFTITANNPTRTHTLAEAITRGHGNMPEVATHSEGDTYVWVGNRWELTVQYRNADITRY